MVLHFPAARARAAAQPAGVAPSIATSQGFAISDTVASGAALGKNGPAVPHCRDLA